MKANNITTEKMSSAVTQEQLLDMFPPDSCSLVDCLVSRQTWSTLALAQLCLPWCLEHQVSAQSYIKTFCDMWFLTH